MPQNLIIASGALRTLATTDWIALCIARYHHGISDSTHITNAFLTISRATVTTGTVIVIGIVITTAGCCRTLKLPAAR